MRAQIGVGFLCFVSSLGWGFVDCSVQIVELTNTVPPSWISKDRKFVVDPLGYVAVVTEQTSRLADYLFQGPYGSYKIRTPQGIELVSLAPALQALLLPDEQYGGVFLPLAIDTPLFDRQRGAGVSSWTFRYFVENPRVSADGRLIIDPSGDLLWRPTEACQAGQLYLVEDAEPARFEYSVKGGRVALPPLGDATPAARTIQRALVAAAGLLTERYTPATPALYLPEGSQGFAPGQAEQQSIQKNP
jgi:hypothetical protein